MSVREISNDTRKSIESVDIHGKMCLIKHQATKTFGGVGMKLHGFSTEHLQGNGPICQVEISPEILLIFIAHLAMTVHKISAADTRCKGVKKLPRFGM
jgi:hypothetical protein